MNAFIQWVFSGITALSVFGLLKKVGHGLWNKFPSVQQLKKDQEKFKRLCAANEKYLAILRVLVAEAQNSCCAIVETRLMATRIEAITGPDKNYARESLLLDINQNIRKALHRVTNLTAEESTAYNREIMRVKQEYVEEEK
jgi:hypothetical protein